jgi:hypothetical protein
VVLVPWHLGRRRSRPDVATPAPPQAEAAPAGADDGGSIRQTIEQRRRELLVAAEDLRPLAESEIAREEDRPSLVARRQQIEEELATGAIERDEAELVEDEQLDALEPALQPRELASIARFEERTDEIGGTPEGDVAALARGLDAERDREDASMIVKRPRRCVPRAGRAAVRGSV